MKIYRVTITTDSDLVNYFEGDAYETARWLQDQVKQFRKEPYMVPQLEGETPLEGLE